ncbi:MAG: hypothetical protein AABZ33_00435 [Chloroflexota bacterium]
MNDPDPLAGHPGRLPRIEFLWFEDCPNQTATRELLAEVVAELALGTPIEDIDATDPAVATNQRFPGSPTIRIDGRDVDPAFEDPGDYTPRCRLYWTDDGLKGRPERSWIVDAMRAALGERSG